MEILDLRNLDMEIVSVLLYLLPMFSCWDIDFGSRVCLQCQGNL